MIHSRKNTYFQMQMVSSTSRMYYSLCNNTTRKILNMYLIVQLRLLMHVCSFFFLILCYIFLIILSSNSFQSSPP